MLPPGITPRTCSKILPLIHGKPGQVTLIRLICADQSQGWFAGGYYARNALQVSRGLDLGPV